MNKCRSLVLCCTLLLGLFSLLYASPYSAAKTIPSNDDSTSAVVYSRLGLKEDEPSNLILYAGEALENLQKNVVESGTSAFVMFYSATCMYCKNAFPHMHKLANVLADYKNTIEIGVIDAVANYKSKMVNDIAQYPTFILYTPTHIRDPIRYEKARSSEAFLEFLKEYVKISVDSNGSEVPPFQFTKDHESYVEKIVKCIAESNCSKVSDELAKSYTDVSSGSGSIETYDTLRVFLAIFKAYKLKDVKERLIRPMEGLKEYIASNEKIDSSTDLAKWKLYKQKLYVYQKIYDLIKNYDMAQDKSAEGQAIYSGDGDL